MARRFTLQPLIEHAESQSDEAARRLHELKMRWQGAEEKLRQLEAYQGEYHNRLQQAGQRGLSATALREYQVFLGKLADAIQLQRYEIENRKLDWERGREEWMDCQRRLKAYETLRQRHLVKEAARDTRIEQKELDEHVGNRFAREPEDKG
jgi:flagellar FliJ protein